MVTHVQPLYHVLDTLLQKRLFRIPEYQRAYSWTKRQRQDLFADITKLIERDDDRHHFMATIVCLKKSEKKEIGTQEFEYLDVVDGQQRITTLILLLKALSKHLHSTNIPFEEEEARDIDKLLVKGDERLILLQTNHDSSMVFANYLRDGTLPANDAIKTHADRELFDAINDCEEFVKKRHPIEVLKICKNRLGFIFYELHDEGAVYTVFEVLNSRGLPVDSLDKCKSMLMGMAFEHLRDDPDGAQYRIEDLHGYWKGIYREIGLTKVQGSEILCFAATLKAPEERSRLLNDDGALDFFRGECNRRPRKVTEISQWLLNVTQKLLPLHQNRRIAAVTEIKQARLLAVAIVLTDSLSDEERQKVFKQWENITFRIFGLFRSDGRHKVGGFIRLAHRIINKKADARNYWAIMGSLRQLGAEYPVEEAVEKLRDDNCYEDWQMEVRYLLYRYEEHLAIKEGSSISNEIWEQVWSGSPTKTIEHICPQAFAGGWADGSSYNFDSLYGQHIHRLGNLLVLPPGINSSAGQKSFGEKKEIYKRNFLRMMNDVLGCDEWTPQSIEQREEVLLKWAKVEFDDLPLN